VVVFPGGGYQILAIDLEGTEVCDWLTPQGITCVLLKYRVTSVGGYPRSIAHRESPMALEDAQRTWAWCDCTRQNGTSIPTGSECLASPRAAISLRQ
jgi:acetyl esterase/lipase